MFFADTISLNTSDRQMNQITNDWGHTGEDKSI